MSPQDLAVATVVQDTTYDSLPYPKLAFSQTHPDRLASIGKLFGLKPTPIGSARILEIGCASGANLLPMAEQLPGSEFVGIDMSRVQIADARSTAERLGFRNIRFLNQNIAEVSEDLGRFDYVLCHGVFSWVPRHVQESILNVCQRHLSSHGIAYISYNTNPGWRMRSMIRDIMLYSAKKFTTPREQLQRANELLKFMADNVPADRHFGAFLKSEVASLQKQDGAYLYHEYLEGHNTPMFFSEFIDNAARHELQYLGEADVASMWSDHLPKHVAKTFERISADLIEMEQLSDFLRNRMFRQTLLCSNEAVVTRSLRPQVLRDLYIRSPLAAEPKQDRNGPIVFKHRKSGSKLRPGTPIVAAMLLDLDRAWPHGIQFAELMKRAIDRIEEGPMLSMKEIGAIESAAAKTFFEGYLRGMIELSTVPGAFTTKISERPVSCRYARLQAEAGNLVTNLQHGSVRLSDLPTQLIRLLDGTNSVEDLPALLSGTGTHGENARTDSGNVTAVAIQKSLKILARNALLSS